MREEGLARRPFASDNLSVLPRLACHNDATVDIDARVADAFSNAAFHILFHAPRHSALSIIQKVILPRKGCPFSPSYS